MKALIFARKQVGGAWVLRRAVIWLVALSFLLNSFPAAWACGPTNNPPNSPPNCTNKCNCPGNGPGNGPSCGSKPPFGPSNGFRPKGFAAVAAGGAPAVAPGGSCKLWQMAAVGGVSRHPVYYRYGSVTETAVDLGVAAPGFSWSMARSYNTLTTGTTVLGTQWLTNCTDYRLVQSGANEVTLIVDATSKWIFTYSGGSYIAPKDSPFTLVHNSDATFTLTDTLGETVEIFYDFSASHKGLLKERTMLAWKAQGRSGVRYTWNSSDQLTQITTPQGQDYNIVFSYTGSNISKIEVRTGADTSTRVQEVDYTYFASGTHSTDVGAAGNLVQVKTMQLKTGGSVSNSADWIVRYTQYRYGSNGLLKMVLEPDSIQRILDNSSFNVSTADAILTKADNYDNSGASAHKVKEYANRQFTYYSADLLTDNSGGTKCLTAWAPTAGENLQSKYGGTNVNETATSQYLVKSETVGGCSACGSGGIAVKFDYFYMDISHGTQTGQAHNEVVRLVVEDTSDGSGNPVWRKVYGFNDPGTTLREAWITDVSGTPQLWCKSTTLVQDTGNKLHRIEQQRTPAAHNVTTSNVSQFLNPYDRTAGWTNDTNTLNSTSGRITVYEYNSSGFQTAERVKVGSSGSAYYVWAADCLGDSGESIVNRKALIASRYDYPAATTDRAASSRLQTQYSYTFWSGTDIVQTMTTTLPAVTTDQNGPGSSVTTTEYNDSFGRLRWTLDGRGVVTYYSYHPQLGSLAYTVRDANPGSLPSSADGNSTKWVTSTSGSASSNAPTRGSGLPTALQQVSRTEFDSQGRTTLTALEDGTTGTILSKHYTVYQTNLTLQFPYWNESTSQPLLPIQAMATNNAGEVTDDYAVDPARTTASGGVPTGLSSGTNQSHYVRWIHNSYDAFTGKLSAVDRYHVIPSSGYGTKDTNYAETAYGHDSMGRQCRVVAPGGTITRTVFDSLGRALSIWIGTDDVPTSGNWSPANNAGANMTQIVSYQYDCGNAGGNSNLTEDLRYTSDDLEANARVTQLKYDTRGRLVFRVDAQRFNGNTVYSHLELDNLGRATKIERYYDANGNSSFPSDGTVDSGDRLLARSEIFRDNVGRVYRIKSYAVDSNNGTVGSCLVNDIWFDATGRAIKQRQAGTSQFTKKVYDGLGRVTKGFLGYDTVETSYVDVGSVSSDTILEQSETLYDASGNAIQTTGYARKAGASGTGELSTSNARASYVALWYDGANRPTAAADYGTNGGGSFTRPSTAPSSSDIALMTTIGYDTAGNRYQTIDPAGKETRQEFDHAGRVIKAIANYTDGDPTTGTADQDVTVEKAYNSDDRILTLTAKNPTTGDQITKYVYGTDQGGITPAVYRNDLLRAEIYPDSDDASSPLGNGSDGVYQRFEYTYDRQADLTETKDPNGTIHDYDYDNLGRLLHDRVTTVGTGVDNAVLRISRSHEIRGLLEKITSYDSATVGSGNVVNEVALAYDNNGLLATDHQEHSGATSASTLSVGYTYDTSTSSGAYTNGLRPTSLVYPNGRLVHFTYGTLGGTSDVLNRMEAINDDSSGSAGDVLAQYTYLGRSQIVNVDYPQASLRYDLDPDTAGTYAGLDRFGRLVDLLWRDYGRSSDAVRIQHGYDRAGNRLWRQDPVATAASANLDELYTYDGANQLTHRDRGVLNAGKDAVTSKNFAEDWTLDMTGNWPTFKQDTDGDGTWNFNQSRTHNPANEVTQIASSSDHVAYDRSGNMIRMPKPGDWGTHYTFTFDPWKRLVAILDDTATVATYAYDGRNFRIARTAGGATRHYYYTSGWQVVEERIGSATTADRQLVWGLRYIDDLVLRDRNADTDAGTGTLGSSGSGLEERLYGLQDANWNVVAIAGTDGAIQERYAYTAYGRPVILTAGFSTPSTSSSYGWDALYAGRQYDEEIGLYQYRNRYYGADLGRFLSRDPIHGDLNLYRYVGNSPSINTDPTGLMAALIDVPASWWKCAFVNQALQLGSQVDQKLMYWWFWGNGKPLEVPMDYFDTDGKQRATVMHFLRAFTNGVNNLQCGETKNGGQQEGPADLFGVLNNYLASLDQRNAISSNKMINRYFLTSYCGWSVTKICDAKGCCKQMNRSISCLFLAGDRIEFSPDAPYLNNEGEWEHAFGSLGIYISDRLVRACYPFGASYNVTARSVDTDTWTTPCK